MKIRKFFFIIFIIGIGFLMLDISGIFISLRNPDIYTETSTTFKNDITIDYDDAIKQITRRVNESDEEYVFRISRIINRAVVHYWRDEGIEKYNLRIPIWENYLLYFASFVRPDIYRKYEYVNYKKAIERGVGLCSQHAMIVTGILNNNGIDAGMIGLKGHVVLRAKVKNNTWYVVDPSYGIVIPHDISEIEINPELIRPYYANIKNQYRNDSNTISLNRMVEIYGKNGNTLWKNGIIGYKTWKILYIEYLSYIIIWIVPLIMLVPYSLTLLKKREQESRQDL